MGYFSIKRNQDYNKKEKQVITELKEGDNKC